MSERKPSVEEQFLIELSALLGDDGLGDRTTMLARFQDKSDTGGPGGSDLEAGKVIPKRAGVLVFLWPTDASTNDKPAFVSHMVCEPEAAWTAVAQPASVEVRGRLGKGSAIVIDVDGARLRSLHPTTLRRFRSPRLGI